MWKGCGRVCGSYPIRFGHIYSLTPAEDIRIYIAGVGRGRERVSRMGCDVWGTALFARGRVVYGGPLPCWSLLCCARFMKRSAVLCTIYAKSRSAAKLKAGTHSHYTPIIHSISPTDIPSPHILSAREGDHCLCMSSFTRTYLLNRLSLTILISPQRGRPEKAAQFATPSADHPGDPPPAERVQCVPSISLPRRYFVDDARVTGPLTSRRLFF